MTDGSDIERTEMPASRLESRDGDFTPALMSTLNDTADLLLSWLRREDLLSGNALTREEIRKVIFQRCFSPDKADQTSTLWDAIATGATEVPVNERFVAGIRTRCEKMTQHLFKDPQGNVRATEGFDGRWFKHLVEKAEKEVLSSESSPSLLEVSDKTDSIKTKLASMRVRAEKGLVGRRDSDTAFGDILEESGQKKEKKSKDRQHMKVPKH